MSKIYNMLYLKKIDLVLILLIFALSSENCFCETDKLNLQYGSGKGLFLNFYQKYISPIDGKGNCRMYPTCSQYAKIAFDTQNPFSAYNSSMNRILVCGRDIEYKNTIFVDGEYRYLDLPENYTPPKQKSVYKEVLPQDFNIADSLLNAGFIDFSLFSRIQSFYECQNDSMRKHISIEFLKTGFKGLDLGSFYVYAIHFEDLFNEDQEYMQKLHILLAAKLYFHGDYDMAIGKLLSSGSTFIDSNLTMKSILFFSTLKDHNYSEILSNSEYYDDVMNNYSITVELIENLNRIKLKSPAFARYSSYLLPGAGYFYAEHKSTGLASFLVNSLIIFSAYELFSHENYITGSTVCLLGSGWYLGSAKGSAKAVQEYNIRKQFEAVDKITWEFNVEKIVNEVRY